jgi:Tol biopolymer transport system component
VYIWQGAETEPRQLTDFPGGACQPDWSPDGQRVVFISPCPGNQDEYRNAGLFILNADGGGLIPLETRPGGDFSPAWSPDGKTIAFVSLRDPIKHIYLYNLETNQTTRLSPPSTWDSHPDWSPDGSKIVFDTTRSGEDQVWTVNPDGSTPREFSPAGGSADSMPVWAPDGSFIYYIAGAAKPVLKMKAYGQPGAAENQIGEFQPVWKPSISPDSRLIAFEGLRDDRLSIYIIRSDGGEPLAVISHAGSDFDPSWRP